MRFRHACCFDRVCVCLRVNGIRHLYAAWCPPVGCRRSEAVPFWFDVVTHSVRCVGESHKRRAAREAEALSRKKPALAPSVVRRALLGVGRGGKVVAGVGQYARAPFLAWRVCIAGAGAGAPWPCARCARPHTPGRGSTTRRARQHACVKASRGSVCETWRGRPYGSVSHTPLPFVLNTRPRRPPYRQPRPPLTLARSTA